jgi:shikimate dehydrogenase
MHNAAMAQLGLDWRYLAFDVHPDHLRTAIEGARAMRFLGLNLTVPHKLLAVPMMDVLDESAVKWGAVNTVRFEGRHPDGDWRPLAAFADPGDIEVRCQGFNTDADAIIRALREDLGLNLNHQSSVLLLGAGGAARATALRLATEGIGALHLVNRTEAKARELAEELTSKFKNVSISVGYPKGKIDLLLNGTSAGLKAGDPLPYDPARFDLKQSPHVYDMIYRPSETALLKSAKAAGCKTANGLGMLLYQGAKALELWSGLSAPVETMRTALTEVIYV